MDAHAPVHTVTNGLSRTTSTWWRSTLFYNFTKIHKTLDTGDGRWPDGSRVGHDDIVRLLEEVEIPVPVAQAN